MSEDKLHKMIDLYFEGELSSRREKKLLKSLLRHSGGDPEVEEALAVMSAVGVVSSHARGMGRRGWTWKEIAATSAILIAVGTLLTAVGISVGRQELANEDKMIAFVNGVEVDNETEILNIIQGQLDDMNIASEDFNSRLSNDLEDISNALNEDEI